ncbi:selenium cofactor biosynthesis protein YqeC [Olsenella sp. HMSC062G07]|uniref:selenium cofactor biosynthesis protein YqeC n=1 Tax=Olsenella sp. HMSC062G07 TaxID=1739330 RepID=UPI0008A13E55|nr:selenium cofactor biosynthesis protein YqeC [Olsenella sp. HMSC062G07]
MNLYRSLRVAPGVTSVVGSGGKTSLLARLARELPGSVILTTSTHILPFDNMPLVTDGDARSVEEALKSSRVVCVGSPEREGKLAAPSLSAAELARLADYVLVEADGAHGRPLKAHADWEPNVPATTRTTILLVGASGFGRRIAEVVHRPQLICERLGVDGGDVATPELMARHLAWEMKRGVVTPDVVLVNQCDGEGRRDEAARFGEELARLLSVADAGAHTPRVMGVSLLG